MELISKEEIFNGKKGFAIKAASSIAMTLLGINKINAVYQDLAHYRSREFCEKACDKLGIKYEISEHSLRNVPPSGGVVIVANHATGMLDVVALIGALSKIRPDIKFLSNFMLDRVETIKEHFISIDNFNAKSTKNINGIRKALEHLEAGGALVVFPSGEVSTYQKGFTKLTDKPWSDSMMKFIRRSSLPIVPLYIDGRNSRSYYIIEKLHPELKTAMIPRELMKSNGSIIKLAVGAPITAARMSDIKTIQQYSAYIRSNVYMLKESLYTDSEREISPEELSDIIAPVPKDDMRSEIDAIRGDSTLFNHASYSVFCVESARIPRIMVEISRLREITYRYAGEGTDNECDSDIYDNYYRQLFIWDNNSSEIIGAYRVGFGDEVIASHSQKGLYTNSLFKMSDAMIPMLEKTIELGRSFIVREHQRKPIPLMLLWKGILYVLIKNEKYRYLLGPVSISGDMRDTSKMLVIDYIKANHFDYTIARNITPLTGLDGIECSQNTAEVARNIRDIDSLEKIILDIEHNRYSVPVLLKKYIQLGGSVIGFNVDHDFNDTVDALLVLDLTKIPANTIAMLSKELNIDVMARFRK